MKFIVPYHLIWITINVIISAHIPSVLFYFFNKLVWCLHNFDSILFYFFLRSTQCGSVPAMSSTESFFPPLAVLYVWLDTGEEAELLQKQMEFCHCVEIFILPQSYFFS